MKNFKRVAALVAVAVILIVFCLPMIFAFGDGEQSRGVFMAALFAALMVPILIYAMLMVYKMLEGRQKKVEGEIRNLIFDIGNVLVDFDWEGYLKSYGFPEEKYEKIADAVFRSETWSLRDQGLKKEEEYIQDFIAAAPEYAREIREVVEGSFATIRKRDYTDTWLRYLKNQGYRLYALSNYSQYMYEHTLKELSFLKEMDGVLLSWEIQDIKPHASFYQALLTRCGLKAEESVFLDDREDNCQAAERQGIHAIVFENLKQAAGELEKLGVK
ncbi:MAG: HAD family phosphatase [Clostridiales bacterium]|nr:HAD family phosphatase [Clostridiales bacterium]